MTTSSPGTRFGHYEIVGPLGAGGMGEVFRARDGRLGREVALKRLPDTFAADRDRLARFRREAHVLASLNHPHIAAIHGLEESDGQLALILELVEGETLDARLARGAIPLEDVIAISRQIAEGLEAAHEKGIVHRDLKPANIKVTPAGEVKLLDFGLARAYHDDGSSHADADVSHSPTLSHQMTEAGLILGTAAYMAPEQARGKPVDRRADIWAFGVVVFEMLTGRRLFHGETVSDTLAAVLRQDIDWSALPAATPPALVHLLRRCLDRDPRKRLRDIGEARIVLADPQLATADVAHAAPLSPPADPVRRAWPGIVAATATAAIIVAASLALRRAPPTPRVQAAIPAPEAAAFVSMGGNAGPMVVSPDGTHLAFVAEDASKVARVYVQPLATGVPRALSGSDGARHPFWSPDGASVGFFARQQLWRVEIGGGAPVALAPVGDERGGSWGTAGVIVYAADYDQPLSRVGTNGGRTEHVTALDPQRREGTHRYPSFLPDGRRFLYEARSDIARVRSGDGVFVGSIDDPAVKVKLLDHATNAVFAAGRLLFVRNGSLFAQTFDPRTLELGGEAVPIGRSIRFDRRFSFGVFSASDTVLAYQSAGIEDTKDLVWVGRDGRRLGVLGESGAFETVALSNGGHRVAVSVFDPTRSRSHLRVHDLEQGTSVRLTLENANDRDPVWSPDDKTVLFNRMTGQGIELWVKPADGSAAETRFGGFGKDDLFVNLDWSPDGRTILLSSIPGPHRGSELWIAPASGDAEAVRYTASSYRGNLGQFSPDGRWVAFDTSVAGGLKLFLARFPDTGGLWQAGEQDATYPRWTKGGREIVFLDNDRRVFAITVDTSGSAPRFSRPERLFELEKPLVLGDGSPFDVSADGQRFLFVMPVQGARPEPYTLALNWAAALEAK